MLAPKVTWCVTRPHSSAWELGASLSPPPLYVCGSALKRTVAAIQARSVWRGHCARTAMPATS